MFMTMICFRCKIKSNKGSLGSMISPSDRDESVFSIPVFHNVPSPKNDISLFLVMWHRRIRIC
jgi:hypothetical protein